MNPLNKFLSRYARHIFFGIFFSGRRAFNPPLDLSGWRERGGDFESTGIPMKTPGKLEPGPNECYLSNLPKSPPPALMKEFTEDLSNFPKIFLGLSAADFILYAAFAGALWLFFCVVRRKHWLHRKVIPKFAARKDVRREVALSALTCVIYSAVVLLTLLAVQRGWTRLYFDLDAFGWWWFAASLVITIFLHDAYFYWTHRLMHLRALYPIMHRAHHRSTNPTPWAAYAFDPLEAFLHAGIFPLVVFLYPIHPAAFILFMMVQVGFNVFGHSGFEIFPHWFLKSWLGKFFNTPTNHTMHHQHFSCNYGLYFNIWDRLMGTNHQDYEARFHEVTLPPGESRKACEESKTRSDRR